MRAELTHAQSLQKAETGIIGRLRKLNQNHPDSDLLCFHGCSLFPQHIVLSGLLFNSIVILMYLILYML